MPTIARKSAPGIKGEAEGARRIAPDAESPLVYLSSHYIRAKEYLEAIVASTSDAICTTDMSGRVIFFGPGAERMLGKTSRQVVGLPVEVLYEGGRREAEKIMRLLRARGKIENYETVVAAGGRRVHVSMSAALLRDRDGNCIGTLGISKDISDRVELERRLRELSITDNLTGLYNRRHLQERLAVEIQRARRQRYGLSLLLMDLDGFKAVNDRLGHVEGDAVLRRAADAVARSIRGGMDAAFRYGGDEFVILLPGLGERRALRVARRIREALAAGKESVPVDFSCGIACLGHRDSAGGLLRRADARMYQDKEAKKRRGTF